LLDSELPSKELSAHLYRFERNIINDVHRVSSNHPTARTSFYFKDLATSSWVGIGEDEKYIPASLLKLPLAIAYYKLAEADPSLLQQEITIQGPDQNEQRNIKDAEQAEVGKSYTVESLIRIMLVASDNNALQALYTYRHDALDSIFKDLQEQFPTDDIQIANSNYITAKGYSRFLLILYNGTYLFRSDSEKLLEILSHSSFTGGLAAGIPSSITIAHKFGERQIVEPGKPTIHQFHDCGIIYVPSRPYKLCVMSQGNSLAELQQITKEISAAVYAQVLKAPVPKNSTSIGRIRPVARSK
jgi:beta-lactamase class A